MNILSFEPVVHYPRFPMNPPWPWEESDFIFAEANNPKPCSRHSAVKYAHDKIDRFVAALDVRHLRASRGVVVPAGRSGRGPRQLATVAALSESDV